MKNNVSFLGFLTTLIAGGVLGLPLQAGEGVGTSPTNKKVDTRDLSEPKLEVTIHRVTEQALENATPGSGIDDALRVKGSPDKLSKQPPLPLRPNIYAPESGLVADGVTPLLIRVAATNFTEDVTYNTNLEVSTSSVYASCPNLNLNPRLKILARGAFQPGSQITLGPLKPEAYLVLEPVATSEIGNDKRGMASVTFTLKDMRAYSSSANAKITFGVRKPPVVLVHGYNAGPIDLNSDFAKKFKTDRGDDFVIAVGYGNENNNQGNTYGDLISLVSLLSDALVEQVENRKGTTDRPGAGNWAWTRYDAVGHSQGGVLLRVLCSSGRYDSPYYPWPFRSAQDHFRGRFRRLVTVGSPHFGSTLAHLGYLMKESKIDFGKFIYIKEMEIPKDIIERILQSKFRIDDGVTVGGGGSITTPQVLNKLFIPDPLSKLHMLGTTIDGGRVPGPRPGILDPPLPRIFRLLHLEQGDDSRLVSGKRWGEWIAPDGSDGVVDLRSQMAGDAASLPSSPRPNSSRVPDVESVAHAAVPYKNSSPITDLVFSTSRSETQDALVGSSILELLNAKSDAIFAPFPSVNQCYALHAEMNETAAATGQIVHKIRDLQKPAGAVCYITQAPRQSPRGGPPGPEASPPATPETVNLSLQPPAGESPNGAVTWSVVVYGPNGITSEGVTLTPTGTYGENLRIDIAAAVVGEVVVSVQFPSTSGMTVIGEPGVVASRPPGALTGIEVRPGTVAMPAGPTVPLEVWGVYDGTSKALLFTYTGNTTFTSENEALATVDTDGQVTLVAPGATTVQATYNGSLTGSSSIQVWAPAPEVTSPAVASATLGQAFNYQITANGSPVAFSADGLPDELTVNPSTGLVSGTPAFEGLFHFTVGAANSDGQKGIQEVTLTVTGTNQAPTAIGLDTASVPAMQPSGTMVGRLATADANPLDTFTYQLVSGAGDTDNGLFSLSGDILLTSVLIDPAVKPQCAIRLRSTDTGGQPVEQALVLPVLGGPDITGPPVDTIVFSGWAFVLGVEATGREPLAYQWQEGGVDIPGATARTLDLVAGMPGTRSFTVRVSNEFDAVTSVPAMVTVAPLSFGAWTARYAVPGQESILPEGDLNGDGIVNLFDYAFGTEPDQTAAAMPRLRMTGNGPSYVFRRAANIESAIIDILTSTDLDKWNLYVPPPGDLSITPLDNWAEEIEVRLPQQDRMFLKLEVNP